jgi:hypothetical protein
MGLLACPTLRYRKKGADMWWWVGGSLAVIWVIVFFMFAFTALAKGHWVMFIIGFFLPIFWIIGALIEPTPRAVADAIV